MSTITSTPPPKGPRSKHRQNKQPAMNSITSSTVPYGNVEGSYNPSYINDDQYRQNNENSYDLSTPFNYGDSLADNYASPTPLRAIGSGPNGPGQPGSAPNRRNGTPKRNPHQPNSSRPPNTKTGSSNPGVDHTISQNGATKHSSGVPPTAGIDTPVKTAYAGPTFHASPAPSALPMPSFFSKSVPDVSAAGGVKSSMGEGSSEDTDSSPTRPISKIAELTEARENSPLDIFFQADREEKARAKIGSPVTTPRKTPESVSRSGQGVNALPGHNGSPHPTGSSRNHTRHRTNGSSNEMFSMEMEADNNHSNPRTPGAPNHGEHLNNPRAHTAPSDMLTGLDDAQDARQAKSQALKDLLWSPQPQRPGTTIAGIDTTHSSPSQSPSPNVRLHQTAYHSDTGTRPRTNHQYHSQNHPSSPYTVANTGSPHPPTRSSHLRQELSAAKSPSGSDAPQPDFFSSIPRKASAHQIVRQPPTQPNIDSPFWTGHVASPREQAPAADITTMENDLRRILKLDMASSEGGLGALGNEAGVRGR
ncbi:MAG: hypothetical protein M1833_001462 [Piccolia ochrophora]|nr:MAG: hypothetical protein M1833_001462 [Piccolia ochrophora]